MGDSADNTSNSHNNKIHVGYSAQSQAFKEILVFPHYVLLDQYERFIKFYWIA